MCRFMWHTKQSRQYNLTPSRRQIGKAVARGSRKTNAQECFRDSGTMQYVLDHLGNILRSEMKAMISDNTGSVLRSQDIKTMQNFSLDLILQELHVHAPSFPCLLHSITSTKTDRDNQKAIIGMCASILLKHRYIRMSSVQKILSIILYAGHTSKQVNVILHCLQLSQPGLGL